MMKKLFLFGIALNLALISVTVADEKIDAATWERLEKFEPAQLSDTLGQYIGKTIAIEFNFRGKNIHHIKPNWYEGSLWQPDAKARKGFSFVRIIVPKKDLPAFQAITTDATSTERFTVYGRVDYDAHNNFHFVRLFGRKVAANSAGNRTIAW